MSQLNRTFKLDRLYHQFLKPKGIELLQLPFLVSKLYEAGFIEVWRDGYDHKTDSYIERYSETEKLTSRQHRDELFKIIQGLQS
jgi:hypothetical protein